MSTSQAVLQHLPFLRRYARALSGSQASGDAYVAATLESLIASPKILDSGPNPRVALYRLFTKIWNSVPVNGKAEASEPNLPPEQHLTQITPRPRQAFLLVALEGFSEEDAAEILDCDLPTLRELVEGIRPRTRRRNRDRRAHHRGRDLHRHGYRGAGREPRPPGHRRRAHPCRGVGAGREEAARADPRRYPIGRRQFRPRRGQRAARHASRCR